MSQQELESLLSETLHSSTPTVQRFEKLADTLVEIVASGEPGFVSHIKNRLRQIATPDGRTLDIDSFDLETARNLVADETGFGTWENLTAELGRFSDQDKPLLFRYATAAMVRGDFSALESMIGPDQFDRTIADWVERGYFDDEPKTLAEIFSAACMLGYPRTVALLLDHGVDPYAGISTGLAGFHYAASSGRLEVIRLLIERKVPMEVENMYGGTVFGQAMWSAVHEHKPDHAQIVEELVRAGAAVEAGYPEWWEEQDVPDPETKRRIAEILQRSEEFRSRIDTAQEAVDDAEATGDSRAIADSLKTLGNILRRPPFLRDAADAVFSRAAKLYNELGLPLEEAWVKRHIGIDHEYAGRLVEAEKMYDEALALYREHSREDDLNYANAVRYPAVIKERLGKKHEAAQLWEEAHDRYARIHPGGLGEGVAEAAAWLTILALERADLELAAKWFSRASEASSNSADPDTHKFIDEVQKRLERATIS